MLKPTKPEQLAQWLKQDEVILIDVREPVEYQEEHIEKAHLIPLSQLTLDKLPGVNKPIVIHCKLGQRSQQACEKLLELNPKLELYNLEGGIVAWREAGHPVKKKQAACPMSVHRQAEVIKGALALGGTLFGFMHGIFFILPILVGAGLIYNGITGHCYLEDWLSKMPWN